MERFSVSREEIGLLLSYATRPERMSEELIHRLVSGVTGPELIEICSWVGLPESTAVRIVEAGRSTSPGEAGAPVFDSRFKRATVMLLVVMVAANIGLAVAAGFSGVGLVLVAGGGIGVGYLLYRIIALIVADH